MKAWRILPVLFAFVAVYACGGSDGTTIVPDADSGAGPADTGSSTPIPDSGGGGGGDGGLDCAAADLGSATKYTTTFKAGDSPTVATGGTPKAGVFVASGAIAYWGDAAIGTAPTFQEQSVVEFNETEMRTTRFDTKSNATVWSVGPYTANGNQLSLTRRCSSAAEVVGKTVTFRFSADGSSYTVYTASSDYTTVTAYQRR